MTDATPSAADLDRREPVEIVQRLTLEQKVRLLTGADFWSLHTMDEIGLRRLVVSDGPVGVRGESLDERSPSANTPSPTAIAASWDEALAREVGNLLAYEARRKGADVVLAPVLNLHRTPYGGRHFEAFSEDPLLVSVVGRGYIRGIQAAGVGATAKHFVANDSETERFTLDARLSERALRELYLAPFEVAVKEARTWAVMAAYNGVNGTTMTESPLLRDVLQQEWGFDGVTMTDWYAGRSLAAARAGLDLVMPGPTGPWGEALVAAVRAGSVEESAVDDKVERILRLAIRVGAVAGVGQPVVPDVDVAAVLRRVASRGMVLTRNEAILGERPVLPIAPGSTVALVGRHAVTPRTLGGGSAQVAPVRIVTPVDGLRSRLGDRLRVARGVAAMERVPALPLESVSATDGGTGLEVRFIGHDGTALRTERRQSTAFLWLGHLGAGLAFSDVVAIELHGELTPSVGGRYKLGVAGVGGVRLRVDGATVIDDRLTMPDGADPVEAFMRPPQALVEVDLVQGTPVPFEVRLEPPRATGSFDAPHDAVLHLLGDLVTSDDEEIAAAEAMAAACDVAVVVVGTSDEVESEGFDRATLALPGRQDEMVRRVAAVNPRTVVVVNAGAPVLLPWADEVAAILLVWFPGQEFGDALGDVLLGSVEPGGRLPVTWPAVEDGLPTATPVDGVLSYDEDLYIGYRWYDRVGREAQFPFGHGLGYTTWHYESSSARLSDDGLAQVDVRVANVGDRAGAEIVQVYLSRPDSAIERPTRWLAGWARVTAEPGGGVDACVRIDRRSFEHWTDAGWAIEPGSYIAQVGRSSGDLLLTTVVDHPGSPSTSTPSI